MDKRWLFKDLPQEKNVLELMEKLTVSKTVAKLLIQRNITTFEEARLFFRPSLEDLHSPFLLKNMDKAVLRLNTAFQKEEKILIYGDYDVDGTTAVSLVYSFLTKHYKQLEYYIPDRYKEGYGISKQGIDYASENGFSCIITLDCGIKAVELCDYADSLGITIIICDHHNPGETLPKAIVLDPKQKDCNYPFKELSGCGVGFKLMHALSIENAWDTHVLYNELDLVAISIGADIVSMSGENRTLCMNGLQQLNTQPRKGIRSLLKLANRSFPLTITDVVFTVAPRINAAGRLGDAKEAVKLLTTTDDQEIEIIAEHIQSANEERRHLDADITDEALEALVREPNFENKKSTVVYQGDWHKGVIGIVASRLIEKYYRPTIVLTDSGDVLAGSVRSVKGFNVYDALEKCSEHMLQFGGHKYAAGLTIQKEKLADFKACFEEVVAQSILEEQETPEEIIDLEIDFDEVFAAGEDYNKVPRLKRILKQFEPHGPDNMKPCFVTRNVLAENGFRLLKDLHIKATFYQLKNGIKVNAIGFNMPEYYSILQSGKPFDVVYTLEINTWRDKSSLQLNIKDIKYISKEVVELI